MAKKSISDLFRFSLFIFDLDNTIYKEEDYLFQAYRAIAEYFNTILPSCSINDLFSILKILYQKQGREKLFDKFLDSIRLDSSYLPECLKILRSFNPTKPLETDKTVKKLLVSLKSHYKPVFVLTNGNVVQQKNKIKNIEWGGLDQSIHFVFANEIEPKPSAAGVEHIIRISGIEKNKTVMIGDSEIDFNCAMNSGITYFDVKDLSDI
jgi:phosphoglycolate phosphatase-like HAD superfamily hydrolase